MIGQSTKCWLAVAAVAAAALSGCATNRFDDPFAEYQWRMNTVAPGAGDDMAANEALQSVNPSPSHAFDTRIPVDGARMVNAVQTFERGGQSSAASGAATGAAPSPVAAQ